jgi:hypothetical protein
MQCAARSLRALQRDIAAVRAPPYIEVTPVNRSSALRALLSAVFLVGVVGCTQDTPTGALVPGGPPLAVAGGTGLNPVLGDGQTGAVDQPLPQPLVVRVLSQDRQPVAGAVVNWVAASGGGSVSLRQSSTDAQGYAYTLWTLGPAMGEQTVRASGTGGTHLFVANAGVSVTASLVKVSGDSQRAGAGQTLREPLVVRAVDGAQKPLPGVYVRWVVAAGNGTVSVKGVVTGLDGTARTEWTLGAHGAQSVRAAAAGMMGAVFTATIGAPAPADTGAVSMHVLPDPLWLSVGDTARLRVVFLDARGEVVQGPRPTFRSLASGLAVDANGLVRVSSPGAGAIEVRAWPFRRFATVTTSSVTPALYGSPLRSLHVVSRQVRLFGGDTLRLNALWVDENARVSNARDAVWSSMVPSWISVTSAGTVAPKRLNSSTRVTARRAGVESYAVVSGDVAVPGAWLPGILFDGLTMTPAVSVAGSDGRVHFALYYRVDSAVRLARFTLQLRAPDGRTFEETVTGERGSVVIPRGSAPGRYEILRVRTTDTHGQSSDVYPSQLTSLGNPTGFTVTR